MSFLPFFYIRATLQHHRIRQYPVALLFAVLMAALSAPAAGQGAATTQAQGHSSDTGLLSWTLHGGNVYQFDTDIDQGGSYKANRAAALVAGTWTANPDLAISGLAGYSFDRYEFSGNTGMAALDPWEDVREIRFGARAQWNQDEHWTIYGGSTFRFTAEQGANLSSGFQIGGFTAFSYKISETLTVGPGLGVISQIEDSASIFPVLIVDWEIAEDLFLRTGSGLVATQGPGLELVWQFAEQWSASVGGRYERRRFRLDRDGVGQERGLPVYAEISHYVNRETKISIIGGAHCAGELRLENRRGDTIAKQDFDPAPFLGILGSFEF